jgi:DNA polymerase-3 subunit epsilon
MKMLFAVIDIETTGGNANNNKIIEIAVVIHDGQKVIKSWESLINPETYIPSGITELTGITQSMVADAPKFFEIAKELIEITEDTIFVAHNVRFDYSFIKSAFSDLGYTFTRKQLCTIQLTKKIFPSLPSYGLSSISENLMIPNPDRHRAMGDAITTARLLEKIFQEANAAEVIDNLVNLGIKESKLPNNLSLKDIQSLPDTCGVYYFKNERGDIIYVGKSKNIQKRVASHFSDYTEKAATLQRLVYELDFEETGSELASLILESYQIKSIMPEINKAQRAKSYPFVLVCYLNKKGYLCFEVKQKKDLKKTKYIEILSEYHKITSAKNRLMAIRQAFQLCDHLIEGESLFGNPCFRYKIRQCFGACCFAEEALQYNTRATMAKLKLKKNLDGSYLIVEQGRSKEEKCLIAIQNGQFYGYEFIASEFFQDTIQQWEQYIKKSPENGEINAIISKYGAKNKLETIPLQMNRDHIF